MSADVIPHPVNERRLIVEALENSVTAIGLISAFNTFGVRAWDVTPLVELSARTKWTQDENEVKDFASFLNRFVIDFIALNEKPKPQPTNINPETLKLYDQVAAAFEELKTRPDLFWRGRQLSAVLDQIPGTSNPVRVIERYLQLFFDTTRRPAIESPILVRSDSVEYAFLRSFAKSLPSGGSKNLGIKAIRYFVSNPYMESETFSIAEIRQFSKLERPYVHLAFTRFTFPCYERLDPMPESWADVAWLYAIAETPFQIQRLVSAAFELLNESMAPPDGQTIVTINAFFQRIIKEQENCGGISLWDHETATNNVYWLYKFRCDEEIRTDFPSCMCGFGQDDDDPEYPAFDDWAHLIRDARNLGYFELAQALNAYKLLDEIVFLRRITNWPSLISLLLELQQLPHFEVSSNAVSLVIALLKSRGHIALSKRLESFGRPERVNHDNVVKLVTNSVWKPRTREEIEARLIEHLGDRIWSKLKPETKTWLVEADLNWSRWRFGDRDEFVREDWSAPALQFCKAVENELVLSFGDLCFKVGDRDPKDKVTLGSVAHFLRRAASGDVDHLNVLTESGREPPSQSAVKALGKLVSSYRNLAAHPTEFDLARLSELRSFLFRDRKLRLILETLM